MTVQSPQHTRLHPGIQSNIDGERQRLEPFKNAKHDLRRQALRFEQIWCRSKLKPRSKVCAKKSADRQTAFHLYIVDFNILNYKIFVNEF